MADISHSTPALSGLSAAIAAPLRGLTRFFENLAAARAAAEEIEQLSRLSDAALEERGIKRSEISERAVARHFPV